MLTKRLSNLDYISTLDVQELYQAKEYSSHSNILGTPSPIGFHFDNDKERTNLPKFYELNLLVVWESISTQKPIQISNKSEEKLNLNVFFKKKDGI